MKEVKGSFRLTNGASNGNALSIKHYPSGWEGGSRARITTYDMVGIGEKLGKVSFWTSVGLGGIDVYQGIQQDGGTFGTQAQQATGRTVGSISGGWAGAEYGAAGGAAACVWIAGVGAVPCGIAGGVIGGIGGSIYGGDAMENAVKSVQNGPHFENANEATTWFINSGHLK